MQKQIFIVDDKLQILTHSLESNKNWYPYHCLQNTAQSNFTSIFEEPSNFLSPSLFVKCVL